jgi:hypothetical protein
VAPVAAATGRFIVHKTGAAMSGVSVSFVRDSGVELHGDTIRGTSDDEGFFTIEGESQSLGTVFGHMLVVPTAPHAPYTVSNLEIKSSNIRGESSVLGRLVVDPYLILIGELHDRKTYALLPGAKVRMHRLAGGRLVKDDTTFVTDGGGRFAWIEPRVLEFGTIQARFRITLTDGRVFTVYQDVPMQYRDATLTFALLQVPPDTVP